MKKNEAIKFRLSDEEKSSLIQIADYFGCGDLSSLIRVVCKRLIDAHKSNRVTWPPIFDGAPFSKLKVRAGYSITITFEKAKPYEESCEYVEWFLRDWLASTAEDVPDKNYWVAMYFHLNEQVEWLIENQLKERPVDVSLKVWNFCGWDQKAKTWRDLTASGYKKAEDALSQSL